MTRIPEIDLSSSSTSHRGFDLSGAGRAVGPGCPPLARPGPWRTHGPPRLNLPGARDPVFTQNIRPAGRKTTSLLDASWRIDRCRHGQIVEARTERCRRRRPSGAVHRQRGELRNAASAQRSLNNGHAASSPPPACRSEDRNSLASRLPYECCFHFSRRSLPRNRGVSHTRQRCHPACPGFEDALSREHK